MNWVKRKSTSSAKLQTASQEERIHKWKEHFKNLLWKIPESYGWIYQKINDNKLNTELGLFTQDGLDIVLTKIKNKKAASLDEIPPELWKTRKVDDLLVRYWNAVYKLNTIESWAEGYILPFSKNYFIP